MEKNKTDRARQFMPFAALRGFEDLIEKQGRDIEPKKTLSEEQEAALSAKLSALKKGMVVKVVYYNKDGYDIMEGMVSSVNLTYGYLDVIKERIRFSEIYEITGKELPDED